MNAAELFEELPVKRVPGNASHIEIKHVVTSPKEADESSLYVACKTAIFNGRYGVQIAYARGCRAFLCAYDAYPGEGAAVWIADEPERLSGILAARVYGYPARQMTVLGITGSTGKSSITLQTVRVLRDAGRQVSALYSDGTDILGDRSYPGVIVPDAVCIQRQLAEMARRGSEIAVLELSSYQLAHFAAEGIPFTAVLLSNLDERHVGNGEHESLAAYREAKLSLLRCSGAFCVMPDTVRAQASGRVLYIGNEGELWTENVRTERSPIASPHTRLSLCSDEGKVDITLPVTGDFFAENAACTAMLCRIVGLSWQQIAKGLSVAAVPGRLECLVARYERLVYMDAAFLPQDLERVLKELRRLTTGRLCVLLGSVGGRAVSRRAPLVRTAERLADHLYITADDPDFEDPVQICNAMHAAMHEPRRATVLADRGTAIRRAVREMRPGDVLLLLAKPYPAGQLVQGAFIPFDERREVQETFAEF